MFSNIRKRLTLTNAALILALVFAMTGGAFAAKHYLITSTSQISPKVLKALQGKNGMAGISGVQGPGGTAGPAGAGTKGDKGDQGSAGSQGPAGPAGPAGPKGEAGATGVTGTGVTGIPGKIGNPGPTGSTGLAGLAGATGPEGVCGTSHCTLPSGASETGTWGAAGLPGKYGPKSLLEAQIAAISFSVPLAKPVTASVIKKGDGEGEPEESFVISSGECKGTFKAPGAAPGHLCVFVAEENNASFYSAENPETEIGGEAGPTGSVVRIIPTVAKEVVLVNGTWVVTAE